MKPLILASVLVTAAILALLVTSRDTATPDSTVGASSPSSRVPRATPSAPIENRPGSPETSRKEAAQPEETAPAPVLEPQGAQTLEDKYADLTLQELTAAREALVLELSLSSNAEFERYIAKGLTEYVPKSDDGKYWIGEGEEVTDTGDTMPMMSVVQGGAYRGSLTRSESPRVFAQKDELTWLDATRKKLEAQAKLAEVARKLEDQGQ